jgi:hypothetical protein
VLLVDLGELARQAGRAIGAQRGGEIGAGGGDPIGRLVEDERAALAAQGAEQGLAGAGLARRATRAAMAATGPGTTSMRTPASMAARMTRAPGSDTPGVPASLMSATFWPAAMAARTSPVRATSLCSNSEMTRRR